MNTSGLHCGFAFETCDVSFEHKPIVNETKISLYGQIRTMDSSYDWKSEDWLENHFVISCPVIDEFLTTTLPMSKRCAHEVPENWLRHTSTPAKDTTHERVVLRTFTLTRLDKAEKVMSLNRNRY